MATVSKTSESLFVTILLSFDKELDGTIIKLLCINGDYLYLKNAFNFVNKEYKYFQNVRAYSHTRGKWSWIIRSTHSHSEHFKLSHRTYGFQGRLMKNTVHEFFIFVKSFWK